MQSYSLVAVVFSAVALASLLTSSNAAGIVAVTSNCGPTDDVYCPESRQCIPTGWVCDNFPDCHRREDEENCHYTCEEDEFRCADSGCIHAEWQCDGDPDCDDESDERNCPAVHDNAAHFPDYYYEDRK